MRSGRAGEAAFTALVWAAPLGAAAVFLWLLADIAAHGAPELSWQFLVRAPLDAGRAGGIAPVLVSTGAILAVCLAVAVPLGLGTAVLLAEFTARGSRFAHAVRRSLDVLAGVPSIVYGLFGSAFFGGVLGLGFSILSGGLTLACMVLPLLVRTVEEGFRALPEELRISAAALGLSRTTTVLRLLLPAAAPALVVGTLLGVARALAETAALIFTSGYVARMPESLLDSGRALSVHVLDLAMNVPGGDGRAYASALTLVLILLVVNASVLWIGERWNPVRAARR